MKWAEEIQHTFARLEKQVDETVVEEMAHHAEAAWEAAVANGEPSSEAAARIRALITSWCEGTSGPRRIVRPPLGDSAQPGRSWFTGISLDIRQALRRLRRQPGVACLSILMIALGIGVTSTLFSLVNGVLLKPLPWKTASQLIRVFENRSGVNSHAEWTYALTSVTYNAWSDHP